MEELDEFMKERKLEIATFIKENTPEILEAKLTTDKRKREIIELLCRISQTKRSQNKQKQTKEKKLVKVSIIASPICCEKTGFLLLSHLNRLKGTCLTQVYEDPKYETFYNKDGEAKSYTLHIYCTYKTLLEDLRNTKNNIQNTLFRKLPKDILNIIIEKSRIDFVVERRAWDYQWIINEGACVCYNKELGGYTDVEITRYKSPVNQVIILVALPASGKTEMCKRYAKLGYLIYDDFLQDFYKGEILEQISLGKRVCLADPRLCIPKTFQNFIEKVSAFTSDYFVICFENDLSQCLTNNDLRYSISSSTSHEFHKEKIKEMKDNDILNFSKLYDLSIYDKHPHKIIPVYRKKEKE